MERKLFEEKPTLQPQPSQSGFAPRRLFKNMGPPIPMGNIGNRRMMSANPQMHPYQSKPKRDRIIELSPTVNWNSMGDVSHMAHDSDLTNLAIKTPVSILQELLNKRGITPNYELMQMEGEIHEPTFQYRVSFSENGVSFIAIGTGRSKKDAKHIAARALIEKLGWLQLPEWMQSQPGTSPNSSLTGGNESNFMADGSGDADDKTAGNPIGKLQEMCMSQHWPPPTYEVETEVGLPHDRIFTIACTILSFREVGKGKSKKIAKRQAAHKMWARLRENPLDNTQINEFMRSKLEIDNHHCTNCAGDLVSQHSNKPTCNDDSNIDCVGLLSSIANENQFDVTYVNIDEKTYSNQYQCLVQLSTFPVGVCYGSGSTALDAQRQAAQNALEFLKILTKK